MLCLQVPECQLDPPRPQVQTWSGSDHTLNVLPRWPNTTSWPSAWQLDGVNSSRQLLQYNITDGWLTNLVSSANNGSGAEYWYMGSKRVVFDNVTVEGSTFSLAGWPQTQQWNSTYGAVGAAASRNFYFASLPFNHTQTYNTSYRIWGNFSVFVTHLSNNDSTVACHDPSYNSLQGVSNISNCNVTAQRHLQCPFTFRCFSPEMGAATGPRCLDDFDNGYNDTDLLGTLGTNNSPKDVYGESHISAVVVHALGSMLSVSNGMMPYFMDALNHWTCQYDLYTSAQHSATVRFCSTVLLEPGEYFAQSTASLQ